MNVRSRNGFDGIANYLPEEVLDALGTVDDTVADLNDILEQTAAELKSTGFVDILTAVAV